jgi:hypothetical protein
MEQSGWIESGESGGLPSPDREPQEVGRGVASFGLLTNSHVRPPLSRANQCADCGGEIKIFVSPKRNPHSSKLGRGVSMKDHDLCRRCWRKIMHHHRQLGSQVIPRALLIGGVKLRARLLTSSWPPVPREAS